MRFITFCFILLIYHSSSIADEAKKTYKNEEQGTPSIIDGHPYLGSHIGWSKYQDACSPAANDCTDEVFSYGVYLGYQFSAYFALETGLNTYSDIKANYSSDKSSADIWSGELAMVFSLPVTNRTSLYTKLGGAYIDIDKEVNGVEMASSRDWDVLASIGGNYRLSHNWALRGEYKFIDGIGDANTGQADLHSAMLGLTYHFSPVKSVEPYTVASVERTQFDDHSDIAIPKEISLSSEALFDFDSAKLKYNKELEEYVTKLTYYQSGTIKIIGYTDSVGSAEYNQRLSEMRAKSVAEYFKRMGVSRYLIEIEGRGEDNFKATNDTENGRAQNRRVEIIFDTQSELIK